MSRWNTRDPSQLQADLERGVPEKPVTGQVTLTASATTTTLSNNAIRPTSKIALTATTSNAAGALSGLYLSTPTRGQVVINHASTATVDRIFDFVIVNP